MNRTLLTFILIGLLGCSDSRDYKIKFDNVDWLKPGDKVLCKGLVVGEVKKIKVDEDKKILASVSVDNALKITKDSRFIIKSELMGVKYIDIELADNKELLDEKEIQIGQVQPTDTTDFRKLTRREFDSLVKVDPKYKLADTLFKVLGTVKENLDKTKK